MASQTNKPLSAKTVEKMKPGMPDKGDVGDYRGLRVSCGAGGTTTFFYRYKSPVTGKLRQVKLGNFPALSLADARAKVLELKQMRAQGLCPAHEAEMERASSAAEAQRKKREWKPKYKVADLIEDYLTGYIEDRVSTRGERVAGARKRKGQREVRRTLEGDAVPVLGQKVAAEVTRKDIVDLVMNIVGRGANVQAGNVLRELSSAYEFAMGLERLPEDFANPTLLAKNSLRQAKERLSPKKGSRVLSDTEVAKLLKWLPGSAYTYTQKNVIRMALWTGCRTGEICEARWENIDIEAGTFHIRESKTGAERYVQLPHQAVRFLRELRTMTGDVLFPSRKTGKPLQQKQLTEQAWRMRRDNKMLDIEPWTPHDLRRTVRTGLSRLRCPNEIAEAVLGHARGGIEGTYDLHSYEDECREWLQVWADHLDGLMQ